MKKTARPEDLNVWFANPEEIRRRARGESHPKAICKPQESHLLGGC